MGFPFAEIVGNNGHWLKQSKDKTKELTSNLNLSIIMKPHFCIVSSQDVAKVPSGHTKVYWVTNFDDPLLSKVKVSRTMVHNLWQ